MGAQADAGSPANRITVHGQLVALGYWVIVLSCRIYRMWLIVNIYYP